MKLLARHHPARRQRGFTLIEILVSLAIVSIALFAGSQAISALTNGAQRQSDVLLGQMCAENEIIKMRLSKQLPPVGDSTTSCEQAGKTYTVLIEVRGTDNPSIRRVDAKVSDSVGGVVNTATVVGRY